MCSITLLYSITFTACLYHFFSWDIQIQVWPTFCQSFCFHFQIRMIWTAVFSSFQKLILSNRVKYHIFWLRYESFSILCGVFCQRKSFPAKTVVSNLLIDVCVCVCVCVCVNIYIYIYIYIDNVWLGSADTKSTDKTLLRC